MESSPTPTSAFKRQKSMDSVRSFRRQDSNDSIASPPQRNSGHSSKSLRRQKSSDSVMSDCSAMSRRQVQMQRQSSKLQERNKARMEQRNERLKENRATSRVDHLARKINQRPLSRSEHYEIRALRQSIVPHLLMRSYHLPQYDYWEDLQQYIVNNHPLFGICWHHKLHPIRLKVRAISLVGSIFFGLAVTNLIYLAFVVSGRDYNQTYYSFQTGLSTGKQAIDENVTGLEVSNGNIALWTIGAALHALYDQIIWDLAACTCIMQGANFTKKMERYQSRGVYLVIFSVILATALATFCVAIRAAMDDDDYDSSNNNNNDDASSLWAVFSLSNNADFTFVMGYFVELVLTYFLFFPVIGFVLFSGVLGCGKYPIVGGRPYELMVEQQENERELQQDQQEEEKEAETANIVQGSKEHVHKNAADTDDDLSEDDDDDDDDEHGDIEQGKNSANDLKTTSAHSCSNLGAICEGIDDEESTSRYAETADGPNNEEEVFQESSIENPEDTNTSDSSVMEVKKGILA